MVIGTPSTSGEVLLRPYDGASIAERVVVMTDRDPELAGDRAATLDAFADGFGARPKMSVYTDAATLEHELFVAGNERILRDVFVGLHPRSGPAGTTTSLHYLRTTGPMLSCICCLR
jgi:putative ATP-dependent endonuclease of the OLD family